jgi:hypothetical protein
VEEEEEAVTAEAVRKTVAVDIKRMTRNVGPAVATKYIDYGEKF